jgi:hypothetical protein
MPHASISIIGATLVTLFSMTAAAERSPSDTSGIEGTISVSPSHGGPITKDRPGVAPARNVQFLVKAGEATVKTFKTDSEGGFEVALPPGHYIIVRDGAATRIGRWRFEADVVAGAMTRVNWTADSGMR